LFAGGDEFMPAGAVIGRKMGFRMGGHDL
jgi:hypothetical protein